MIAAGAKITRLDHLQLAMPIGGEGLAREFYAGVLGFAEVPKPPELAARGGVWFQASGVAIHLGVETDFRPAKKAHPAFRCTSYESLIERLRECGLEVVVDGLPFEGRPHFYVGDPFGNRLEFIAD